MPKIAAPTSSFRHAEDEAPLELRQQHDDQQRHQEDPAERQRVRKIHAQVIAAVVLSFDTLGQGSGRRDLRASDLSEEAATGESSGIIGGLL